MNSESLRLRARAIHCDSVSDSRENAITTATIHSVYEVGSRNYAWPRILLMTKPPLLLCLREWQMDPPLSPRIDQSAVPRGYGAQSRCVIRHIPPARRK